MNPAGFASAIAGALAISPADIKAGDKLGHLTCVSGPESIRGHRRIVVQCDCGSPPKLVRISTLLRDKYRTVACGCLRGGHETHGMSRTRVYQIWLGIIQRTTNPRYHSYPDYGGRGIDMDPQWREAFVNFYADMGEPPTKKHSIERKDNSLGYWPGNCVWETVFTQAANTRSNVMVVVTGQRVILAEARRMLRVSSWGIQRRIGRGETHQQAIDHFSRKRTIVLPKGI